MPPHLTSDYGHGAPLNPKSRTGILVCHKEFGLGVLQQVYENRMDGEPVTLATVRFNLRDQHDVDCDPRDLTTSFLALSTVVAEDSCDLGERYAPPGEVLTFELTENGSFDVVFHPSGVWWCGATLDEIVGNGNENGYAEVFMSADDALAAGRTLPDVFRPEVGAVRTAMLDVLYDYGDDLDGEASTLEIPAQVYDRLRAAALAASFDIGAVPQPRNADTTTSVTLSLADVDAFAATLGMGERLIEENSKVLKEACVAKARDEASTSAPAP